MQLLNRYSSRPLYRQLVDALEARLSDELSPGDRLPSEAELAQHYDVNRLTVRHALAELARRGRVTTVQGKGSFVTVPAVRYEIALGQRASWTQAMRANGHEVEVHLLRRGKVTARDEATELRTRGALARFDLVRIVDGTPWSVTSTWLPLRRFPRIDTVWDGEASLYELLERHYGARMVRASRTFASLPASAVDAEHLMVPVGAPVLHVRGANVDETLQPIAVVEHRMRGDRVELTVGVR